MMCENSEKNELKKSVLVLANSSGGLYRFRKELLIKLQEKYTVYACTPLANQVESLEKLGINLIDISIDRRGINPFRDMSLLFTYMKIIRRVDPCLIILYTIKPNIYGGLISRLYRRSYVVNITGLGTAFNREGILKSLVIFLYKRALKKAKTVFFENELNMSVFISSGIVKQNQCCLLNGAGVNLDDFKYLDYPPAREQFKFLFVGRIMKEKGIDELFEAMKMLRRDGYNCILEILGGYEENYKEQVELYSKEGWLIYYGYQKNVVPYIQDSNCFVLPSWHEGMANTNLECAASGRPVITSNIPGCMEAVIDGETGFVCPPRNAVELYKTMRKILTKSNDELRNMGLKGRLHMENVFDKTKVVNRTMDHLFESA